MPAPMEICLEELDLPPDDERYIRCVALPGGEPGLALDREGTVRWMPDGPAAYGLWVSADDRLVLQRDGGAGPITVLRGGRSLEAPAGKPVVLLDSDLLRVNGRRLRVHIHGTAEALYAPERLSGSALARMARTAATALALGAAVGAGSAATARPAGATAPIEVRKRPPKPVAPRRVNCTITKMATSKKGPLLVHATCPKGERIGVGTPGRLITKSGKPVEKGTVTVRKVIKSSKGDKIVAEAASLKQPVKAATIQFRALFGF